jgi:hypothetical protein
MFNRSVGVLLRPVIQRLSECTGTFEVYQPVPQCFVRYRKRRWSPITPSKLFVVRERTQQDPREYEQLKTLYQRYRTEMKALRLYMRNELTAKEAELHDKSHIEEEKQHYDWCSAENSKFNELSAKHREERQLKEEQRREEKELRQLELLEKKKREQQQKAIAQVLATQKAAANFVSEQDVESVIEAALNQRSVFNFAIDLDGNRYVEQTDGSTVTVNATDSNITHELTK